LLSILSNHLRKAAQITEPVQRTDDVHLLFGPLCELVACSGFA